MGGGAFCSAPTCSNRSGRNDLSKVPGRNFVRYFLFPKDPELSKQWLLRLKRDKWTPSPWSRICSDHFFSSDFTECSLNRILSSNKRVHLYLKKGAVPNSDPQTGSFRDPRNLSRLSVHERVVPPVSQPVEIEAENEVEIEAENEVECEVNEASEWEDDWSSCEDEIESEDEWHDLSDGGCDEEEEDEWVDVEGDTSTSFGEDDSNSHPGISFAQFTNSKKRNLLYRLVMLWVNRGHPMGKGVRMPVPSCVVNLVQTHFPSSSYIGYQEAEVEAEVEATVSAEHSSDEGEESEIETD